MDKENTHINLSQEHELNYALRRNGMRETELNRDLLKTELEIYKLENDVYNIKNKEVDKIISNSNILEKKDK